MAKDSPYGALLAIGAFSASGSLGRVVARRPTVPGSAFLERDVPVDKMKGTHGDS